MNGGDPKIRRRSADGQSYDDPHTDPAIGPSASVRRRVTKSGGGKAGNQRRRGRIARDGGLKRKGPERDPPHRFRETSTVRSPWQHKIEENEGGSIRSRRRKVATRGRRQ